MEGEGYLIALGVGLLVGLLAYLYLRPRKQEPHPELAPHPPATRQQQRASRTESDTPDSNIIDRVKAPQPAPNDQRVEAVASTPGITPERPAEGRVPPRSEPAEEAKVDLKQLPEVEGEAASDRDKHETPSPSSADPMCLASGSAPGSQTASLQNKQDLGGRKGPADLDNATTNPPSKVTPPTVEQSPEPECSTSIGPGSGAEANSTAVATPEVPAKPSVYQPPAHKPPKPRPADRQPARPEQPGDRLLELKVNAQVDHHGYCVFRLLAKRQPGLLPSVEVRQGHATVSFSELSDAWYEVEAGDLADWLSGVLFAEAGRDRQSNISWQLSTRDFHILAAQPDFSGPTSTTRLTIGRKHLVLCRTFIAEDVKQLLNAAGCDLVVPAGAEMGAPKDWVFFWPVVPTRAVPVVEGDKYNVLRPQPELELLLEGGLCLSESNWLSGFPPAIRVNGVEAVEEAVYMDAQLASRDTSGNYSTAGYADPGSHVVFCAGRTCQYAIIEPSLSWEAWDAYNFANGSICGASSLALHERTLVTVPASNPLLLGAIPGELFQCPATGATEWSGFVPFPVVWALPSDPLHRDKKSSRVLLLTPIQPRGVRYRGRFSRKGHQLEWSWSQAIRDCRKKRLALSHDNTDAAALWKTYGVVAREIWRGFR